MKIYPDILTLPVLVFAVVPVYNIAGITDLDLDRVVLADIFRANITRWNDPRIQATNPGIVLPNEGIHVIVQSDTSGVTETLTR
jgi:phosphate transport system substrate-binding protein